MGPLQLPGSWGGGGARLEAHDKLGAVLGVRKIEGRVLGGQQARAACDTRGCVLGGQVRAGGGWYWMWRG